MLIGGSLSHGRVQLSTLCHQGGVKAIYAVTEHCVVGAKYNDTSILMFLLHIWRISFVLESDVSSFY